MGKYNTTEKQVRFGTLNVRGIKSTREKQILANDMNRYRVAIMAVQETHLKGSGIESIETTNHTSKQPQKYTFYYTGEETNKFHGVGIIFDKNKFENPILESLSDRICQLSVKLPNCNRKLVFISAYAPTLTNSEKNPETREKFYETLDKAIRSTSSRDLLIIAGDFNAKTGSAAKLFSDNMGHFGKGEVNSNGNALLDLARKNQLVLTNTLFNHKMAHRTTWECPERITKHQDKHGNIRRNPYRNQIDYTIMKTKHKDILVDSRSYNGIDTNTDHRLVLTTINFNWWFKVYDKKNMKKVNYDVQQLKNKSKEYKEKVREHLENELHMKANAENTQDQWNRVKNACLSAAEETIPIRKDRKKSDDAKIKELSAKQKKLRLDSNASRDKTKRQELKQERNRTLRKIHEQLQKQELSHIENLTAEIENSKNDSTRMFKAVRALKTTKPQKKLIVDGADGIATTEHQQLEVITDHFKNIFHKPGQQEMKQVEPTEMSEPFTAEEVKKAVTSLSNNKSAGSDQLKAELLKHSPEEIFIEIAAILNEIARTGNFPKEVKEGILVPLPKPGKKQGPPQNLRPIILLSILRKILAIIMIRRTSSRLNETIPITQAAYRAGRNTTEHVFTLKLLAEKAITSSEYEIHILLLDMSKAFDTVERAVLMDDLSEILYKDELHIFDILLRDVEYKVRCGQSFGENFKTNIGTPQGDCASAVLFTLYLAKALQDKRTPPPPHLSDHTYFEKDQPPLPDFLHDHNYDQPKPRKSVNINQQYADDIGYATTSRTEKEKIKNTIPPKLKKRNLGVNLEKTEEYTLNRKEEKWKKCKYLGSILDTENDIKRRKGLAIDAFNSLNRYFTNRRANIKLKTRIFTTFVQSIFLYNSELWTLTKQQETQIDVFQRSLLRRLLNVTLLDKIRNEYIYERTNTQPWSQEIKRRRLSWLGHLLRLPEGTPARQAVAEFLKPAKRPRGKPRTTWFRRVENDLKNIINFQHVTTLANDRIGWRNIIARAMLDN